MRFASLPRIVRVLVFLPLALVMLALVGLIVMLLWNGVVPGLFGLHPVTYAQAILLLILCRILFGGSYSRRGFGGNRHWRRRVIDRWERMSPEQREMFRAGMRPLSEI